MGLKVFVAKWQQRPDWCQIISLTSAYILAEIDNIRVQKQNCEGLVQNFSLGGLWFVKLGQVLNFLIHVLIYL